MFLRPDVYVVRGTTYGEGQVLHTLAYPGELDVVALDGVPTFGWCGVQSRPAPPDDDGQVEAIVADIGGTSVIVAMRDTRAPKVAGTLDEGDEVFVSAKGRCGLWAKGSGVLSLRKDGADGSTDSAFQFEADGSARLVTPFGGFECGPNGWKIYTNAGQVLELSSGLIQLIADAINLVGALGLGTAPSLPLVQSTPGPQIGATALPVLSIKITPG